MPPAIGDRLCICKVHGCYDNVDPGTNRRGKLLKPRDFRAHQRRQQEEDLKQQQRALDVQSKTLAKHDQAIEEALSRLSLSDPQSIPSFTSQLSDSDSRFETKKRVAAQLGGLLDETDVHKRGIEALQVNPGPLTDSALLGGLDKCSSAYGFIERSATVLATAKHSAIRKDPSIKTLIDNAQMQLGLLQHDLKRIETLYRKEFGKRETVAASTPMYNSGRHFKPILESATTILQLVAFMVVSVQVIFGIPRRGCHWIFQISEFIIEQTAFSALGSSSHSTLPNKIKLLLSKFPRDVRTATSYFNIDAESTVYAACPKCHEIYPPKLESGVPIYPEKCRARRRPHKQGGPVRSCRELLVRPKQFGKATINAPIKPYIAFSFHDWMANLLSRRNYEKTMDSAWDRMQENEGDIEDIFQATCIKNFKGHDKRTHFGKIGDKDSGRYLFSLGFDFFNPLRNLAAGKKVSIGVIALICLNLPIDIRYKPENIFLAGIIPGPSEPSLDALNPYLRPLVDALLLFWDGVRFSKTALYELGRCIYCAIIAIIADLPAARKIGGFSSHSHEFFCSVCTCSKTKNTYNDIDYTTWTWRTNESCRNRSEKYRNAQTQDLADRSFDLSGLRSSELLRLPYYDATKHLPIDPMHNLFLGLVKEHFQNILGCKKIPMGGLPESAAHAGRLFAHDANNLDPDRFNVQQKASIRRLEGWLKEPFLHGSDLQSTIDKHAKHWAGKGCHLVSLIYIGRGLGCIPSTVTENGRDSRDPDKRYHKPELAKLIVEWRSRQPIVLPASVTSPGLAGRQGYILTSQEMDELRRDISAIVQPSWATTIPISISSSGPKLKSDQWRAAGSVYLPITLIRLWSSDGTDTTSQERRDLLNMTMELFQAVSVITSRTTSAAHERLYLGHMLTYRQNLARLFPDYNCHPNHHMAMHLGEFLAAYGPVHGWWTFPFERMIGTLQQIHTNYHPGEYEATIGESWHRRSNLRALFSKVTCPPIIAKCASMFESIVQPQNQNFLANYATDKVQAVGTDDQDTDIILDNNLYRDRLEVELPDNILNAFTNFFQGSAELVSTRHIRANLINRYTSGRISYTSSSIHEGNSQILTPSGPYCIQNIVVFRKPLLYDDVWLVAKPFRAAKIKVDPYMRYQHLRAKIWSNELEEFIEVIPLSMVDTHFSKCVIQWEGKEVAVCVSLSRVVSV